MKYIKTLAKFGLIGYTMVLAYWMLLGFGRRFKHHDYMYNIIPFQTIKQFLQFERYNTDIWVINILGNIGVFMPFGILIPIVFGKKLFKSYMLFFVSLFTLELLQLITKRGSFDVDDLILNSVGFLIGYGIYRIGTVILGKIKLRKTLG